MQIQTHTHSTAQPQCAWTEVNQGKARHAGYSRIQAKPSPAEASERFHCRCERVKRVIISITDRMAWILDNTTIDKFLFIECYRGDLHRHWFFSLHLPSFFSSFLFAFCSLLSSLSYLLSIFYPLPSILLLVASFPFLLLFLYSPVFSIWWLSTFIYHLSVLFY